jgi:hypothetical protein
MLELKSALFEALTAHFNLAAEPSPEHLLRIVRNEGSLDEATHSALKDVLATMQRVEASMVAGKPAAISRPALARASSVVRDVLKACRAESGAPPVPPADSLHAPGPRALSASAPSDISDPQKQPPQGERSP